MSRLLFGYCTIILIIYNHIPMTIHARIHRHPHFHHNHDHSHHNDSLHLSNSMNGSSNLSPTTMMRRSHSTNNNDTVKSLKLTLVNSYHSATSGNTNYNNAHRWQQPSTQQPQYANDEKEHHNQQQQQNYHHNQQQSNPNQFVETFVWKNQHKETGYVGPTATPRSLKDRSYTKHHAGYVFFIVDFFFLSSFTPVN